MATNERYVSTNADLKVARSRFPLAVRSKFSLFHGYLHPVGAPIEVLPGDTFKAKISVFTRMSTPIVPFADDVRQECDFFFVPKRILWNKTKQFYGEAPSFGVATKVYEPYSTGIAQSLSYFDSNLKKSEAICAAFGLVYNDATGSKPVPINILPIRSLFAVYNEYFRDENYQDQYSWDKDASGATGSLAYLGASLVNGYDLLPVVNKDRDVVTSVLPWAQKGDPVSIGLAGTAPVLAINNGEDSSYVHESTVHFAIGNNPLFNDFVQLQLKENANPSTKSGSLNMSYDGENSDFTVMPYDDKYYGGQLFANLAGATAVKINDLLYALAYQDFLARSAHFGTRYKEYIYSMFGTKIPDLSDDIPEYLGRLKFNINVQQVVQTTGFAASASTELGALGAYSNSGKYGEVFNKSFTEPGYLVCVTYTKHRRTYSSGIDRVFLKNELLDYYQPPFANIPDLPFGSFNVWLDKTGETSLGFQEPWFDYRALQDRTYGMLNPLMDTIGEIWTLAEKWTRKPTIAGDFMKEDRACIARALATGVNGPDYLVDALLEIDATRVMPLYSSGRLERF